MLSRSQLVEIVQGHNFDGERNKSFSPDWYSCYSDGSWRKTDRHVNNPMDNMMHGQGGMGISEADLPLIFELFYRADKSRTRETGGTGIGLALVRQIIDLHQGTINVQSKIGHDTEFFVQLPKKVEVAEE